MGIFSFVSYKEMQTQEDVSIEDAVLGSGVSDCGEATDEEPKDEEEGYESPYITEDETTTEAEISEEDGEAVPNKYERLDIYHDKGYVTKSKAKENNNYIPP